MPESRCWKVAIVGAGIGAEHAAAYAKLPQRFHLHSICDLDTDRAKALLEQAPDAAVTASLDAVLADPDIDLVDICLPPHLHFDACQSALEAGKDVICEKPLVTSLADADRLIAIAVATGKHVFPVFQYRYGPGSTKLKALIDAGLAGKAYTASLETHWHRDRAYYDVPWRGTWAGEQGGAILTHAIHSHDWLSFILGPVTSVYARLATRVNLIETEDCAALAIEMENGALATSSITLGAANDTSRLRFCFGGLTAESGLSPYAPATDDWTFIATDPQRQKDIDDVARGATLSAEAVPLGYHGFFVDVADALEGTKASAVSLHDARRSLEFVTAVYASSREHCPVTLPIADNHTLYKGWLPR